MIKKILNKKASKKWLFVIPIICLAIAFSSKTKHKLTFEEYKTAIENKSIVLENTFTKEELKENDLPNKEKVNPVFVKKDHSTNREVNGYLNIYKEFKTFEEFNTYAKEEYKTRITESNYSDGIVTIPFKLTIDTALLDDKEKNLIQTTINESGKTEFNPLPYISIGILCLLIWPIFKMQSGGIKGGTQAAHSDTKFDDVAGIEEAKEELSEVVHFLKNPAKYLEIGASTPKGVLLTGASGTGKTLLAKAVAGEAEVPFFTASGSDFIEKFAGVGASRMRNLFKECKAAAPCILFIDEIDAVASKRDGNGSGGGAGDERTQTINAMLVEMDGFSKDSGIIVIGATNRHEAIDNAILRPGRFDRIVHVSLPDLQGRKEILAVHARDKKISDDVCLTKAAQNTTGFSGAELANLLNEAAIIAVNKGKEEIDYSDIRESRDKVMWGKQRKSLKLSSKEKNTIAYHEAGHAICNLVCEHTDTLEKVTIVPRGDSLGMAMFTPEENRVNYRYNELLDQICVAMGGRAAEELKTKDITSGASGDIQQATNIAYTMVTKYGMSPIGMNELNPEKRQLSPTTLDKIDLEVKELIDDGYKRAIAILKEHEGALEKLTSALLEKETITGEEIREFLDMKKDQPTV